MTPGDPPTLLLPESLREHRAALAGHCYRMLGSICDAEDAVQETLLRAWRAQDRFEQRSSLRTWLYRIATRVCLDAIQDAERRERPVDLGPAGTLDGALDTRPSSAWLEPAPDALILPADEEPAALLALRQSVRLAFVAALQRLPARQRAALLLSDVLGWPAAEVADSLAMTVPAVNSALQRARSTLAALAPAPTSPLLEPQQQLLDRFVEAFERYDMDRLAALLREDVVMSMPPYTLWLQGAASVQGWMLGRGAGCQGSRLIATRACGGPAFGQYRPGGLPWALVVPGFDGEQIDTLTFFLDTAALFPRFGLPLSFSPEHR